MLRGLFPLPKAGHYIRAGLGEGKRWKVALGAIMGAWPILRRATSRQPEVVQRVRLEPGERVVIETADPMKLDRKTRRR
jgi:hypothetical protein